MFSPALPFARSLFRKAPKHRKADAPIRVGDGGSGTSRTGRVDVSLSAPLRTLGNGRFALHALFVDLLEESQMFHVKPGLSGKAAILE